MPRKRARKHSNKKEERRPPSDARPPIDYRDEARRAIRAGARSPEHV